MLNAILFVMGFSAVFLALGALATTIGQLIRETLAAFLTRLRSAAESLSVVERQKIVLLLVKEILVGEDTITIRHSIPIPSALPQSEGFRSPKWSKLPFV